MSVRGSGRAGHWNHTLLMLIRRRAPLLWPRAVKSLTSLRCPMRWRGLRSYWTCSQPRTGITQLETILPFDICSELR